ncbi:predicted protein [Nematostella vectensis]|uniref:Inositol 2-dehydrogenase n=1 Tax=Nematostella vectensis TaxID=45351 RepID=A7SEM3_NEMVE|nr:uncharacterized oxidoreductase YrbE [Nematostella vectensis]EDO37814.1 predicted protein [Nematostella vectensis]|eukprot:XP_001629877.1 predicted protein [Nematostella vectensis]
MATSTERVGIALFALGRAGMIHAGNLIANSRAELKYIIEEDTLRAEKYLQERKTHAKVLQFCEASVALSDPSVKAVLVCTPTPLHEQCVLMALRAGKAVFCEKPLSRSIDGTALCYNEAEKAGLPLFCAFNRRFDPGIRSIIKSVLGGKIGRVHMIKQTSRDASPPSYEYVKSSGGIFHDSAVHDLDVTLTIAGEAPLTIHAVGSSFVPHIKKAGDVDSVVITLKFPSGALAQIDLDRSSPCGYDQRLEVLGESGMLQNGNKRANEVTVFTSAGNTQSPILGSFAERYAESYERELEHFLDVVLGKAVCEVTRKSVLLASEVATACQESLVTGRVMTFQN